MALSYRAIAGNGGQPGGGHNSLEDLFAQYKYKNTIGLLYMQKEKAEITDVLELLRKLNINRMHLEGVQRDSERRYSRLLLKFKSQFEYVFERVKSRDRDVVSVRGGEARVMVQDMTGEIEYVSVVRMPFEIPDKVVVEIMSRFGTVKDIKIFLLT